MGCFSRSAPRDIPRSGTQPFAIAAFARGAGLPHVLVFSSDLHRLGILPSVIVERMLGHRPGFCAATAIESGRSGPARFGAAVDSCGDRSIRQWRPEIHFASALAHTQSRLCGTVFGTHSFWELVS